MRSDKYILTIGGGLGGLLAGLGILHGWVIFTWFGIALLWLASRSSFAGFLWGVVVVLVSHSWLLALHPLTWIGVPDPLSLPLAITIWMFCGFFSGLLVGIWSWISNSSLLVRFRDGVFLEKVLFVLFLSSLWGLAEVVLAHYPLFWIGLGGSVFPGDRSLGGLAAWIGAGGLATVQLLIGFWLCNTLRSFNRGISWRASFFFGFVPVLLAHMLGSGLLIQKEGGESIPVALWQPDIPIRKKFSKKEQNRLPEVIQKSLERAKDLSASWLVAPEGTLGLDQDLLSPAPVSFLTGGFRWVRGGQRSSLLVFDSGESRFSSFIDKYRLVPIGEKIPSFSRFSIQGLSAVGGLEPGNPSRLLFWSGPPLAAAICYELSDGHALAQAVKNGAEWILALANLDPYPISLQRQFVALAQLRSVENSRDLISVANRGPSALVLTSGEVKLIIPPFTEDTQLADLHLHRNLTGYTRWQEAPLIGLFIVTSLGTIFLRLRN